MKKRVLILVCIILIIIIFMSLFIIIKNIKYNGLKNEVEVTNLKNQSSIDIPPDFMVDKEKVYLKRGQSAIINITAPYKQKFNVYTSNQNVFSISDNINTKNFTNDFILDNSSRTITIKAENIGTEWLNIDSVKIINDTIGTLVRLKEVEIIVSE